MHGAVCRTPPVPVNLNVEDWIDLRALVSLPREHSLLAAVRDTMKPTILDVARASIHPRLEPVNRLSQLRIVVQVVEKLGQPVVAHRPNHKSNIRINIPRNFRDGDCHVHAPLGDVAAPP